MTKTQARSPVRYRKYCQENPCKIICSKEKEEILKRNERHRKIGEKQNHLQLQVKAKLPKVEYFVA